MRVKLLVLLLVTMLVLTGCGKGAMVSCDHCGKEMKVRAGSNVDDSWIVYCEDCELELFGEEGLVPEE